MSQSPVLIESTLVLMPPDQCQTHPLPFDPQSFHTNTLVDENENLSPTYRRAATAATHRVPVPVHNAAHWFNGPNMQNERSGRMEKVVASLLRRSFRPISSHAYVE
jgi:hypothetical protein